MTEQACVHGCMEGWITTATGLMPCPRHMLETHERWAKGQARPSGGRIDTSPPDAETVTTGRAGLSAARANLPTAPTHQPTSRTRR